MWIRMTTLHTHWKEKVVNVTTLLSLVVHKFVMITLKYNGCLHTSKQMGPCICGCTLTTKCHLYSATGIVLPRCLSRIPEQQLWNDVAPSRLNLTTTAQSQVSHILRNDNINKKRFEVKRNKYGHTPETFTESMLWIFTGDWHFLAKMILISIH